VRHEAVLSFGYASSERARRVERALVPEVGDIDDDRSRARLCRKNSRIEIAVTATDLVAFRAGLNTWCTLVTVAEQTGNAY